MRPTALSLLAVAGSLISFAAAAAPDLDADLAALNAAKGPPEPPSTSGFWVGAGVQADIAFLSGTDLCGRESQSAVAYSCFRPDEEQYLGVPEPSASAGLTPSYGTTRITLQIERVLPYHLSVGGRIGFAFGGGPTPAKGPTFVPLHLEASISYWFNQPLSRATGLRGFASFMGGMAQMDASRSIAVDECRAGSPSGCAPATNVQPGGDNPDHQTLDAYKKAGQGFVGLGLGAFYSFVEGSGLLVEVRALQFFPSAATTLSPSLGYVFQVL